jgi:hypothetical protein
VSFQRPDDNGSCPECYESLIDITLKSLESSPSAIAESLVIEPLVPGSSQFTGARKRLVLRSEIR